MISTARFTHRFAELNVLPGRFIYGQCVTMVRAKFHLTSLSGLFRPATSVWSDDILTISGVQWGGSVASCDSHWLHPWVPPLPPSMSSSHPLSLSLFQLLPFSYGTQTHTRLPLPSPRSHTEPAGVQPHPMEPQYSNRHIRTYAPPNPGTDFCSHDCMAKHAENSGFLRAVKNSWIWYSFVQLACCAYLMCWDYQLLAKALTQVYMTLRQLDYVSRKRLSMVDHLAVELSRHSHSILLGLSCCAGSATAGLGVQLMLYTAVEPLIAQDTYTSVDGGHLSDHFSMMVIATEEFTVPTCPSFGHFIYRWSRLHHTHVCGLDSIVCIKCSHDENCCSCAII